MLTAERKDHELDALCQLVICLKFVLRLHGMKLLLDKISAYTLVRYRLVVNEMLNNCLNF